MRFVFLILILTTAGPSTAADLNLTAAVEHAIAGNPAVKAAAYQASAAAKRHEQARSFRLPSVDLLSSYGALNNPAEAFALQLNQGTFDMEEFFNSDPNNPDTLTNFLTRLEVTLPVYTGGQLSSRIGQAHDMASSEQSGLGFAVEKTAFETIVSYVNLAKAREFLALAERSHETTLTHVKLAENYATQGLILNAEVLKAHVHLAELEETLAQARSGARLAEAALNFTMGADHSAALNLNELPPNPPVGGALDDWVASALVQRQDLRAALHKLEAGRKEVNVKTSKYKPEVAILGRYDFYDEDFLKFGADSGSIMAVARINLYRGGADRAAIEASRLDLESGTANIEHFEAGIRLEVEQSWQEITTAKTRHKAALASVAAAEEALRVREHRFKQGLDKMIDLVDAETALHGSRLRELVARYDLALATYKLYFNSGASLIEAIGADITDTQATQKRNV